MKLPTAISVLLLLLINEALCQEVQTNVDLDNKIEYINQDLETRIHMFPEIDNFKEARLFKISDSLYALEIYYKPEEKLLKIRQLLNRPGVLDFQKRVSEILLHQNPKMVLDQGGRSDLITWSTILSLSFYGVAVPAILDVENTKLNVALYLLTGAAGFYYPLSATRDMQVTDAAATMAIYGATRGLFHGSAFANLVAKEPSERVGFLSTTAFSIIEGFIGFNYANKNNFNAGTSEVIGVGGDFGMYIGMGIAAITESSDRGFAGSMLLGSGLGLLGGKWISNKQHFTRGDAFVLNGSGLLGAYASIAIIDVSGSNDNKTYITASILGSLGGLWVGNNLVKGKDFSRGQGNLIQLGEITGGLLGAGIAYLITPEDNMNSKIFLASSTLGAMGGFWFMYNSYVHDAQVGDEKTSLNINLNPLGLYSLASNIKSNPDRNFQPTIISINYRF